MQVIFMRLSNMLAVTSSTKSMRWRHKAADFMQEQTLGR